MSIVDTYKSEFQICLFDEDFGRSETHKQFLEKQGFQIQALGSHGLLMESLSGDLAHVYILYYQPLSMKFRQTIDRIRETSDDVEIVLLGARDFWPGIENLINNQKVDHFWSYPFAGPEEFEHRLEKLIEKRIYRLIAEQRSEETAKIVSRLDQMVTPDAEQLSVTVAKDIMGLISRNHNSEAQMVTEFIDMLKKNHPGSEFIYFKNYQSKNQLLVTRTSFASDNYFRGQSLAFSEPHFWQEPEKSLNDMTQMIGEQFSVDEFSFQPVEIARQLYGFVMAVHYDDGEHLNKACRYLALSLRNLRLESSNQVDVFVQPDDILIKNAQLAPLLSREVSRARRLKLPVTVIHGQIDFLANQKEEFHKLVAELKGVLRSYDFLCTLSDHQLVVIMPHCGFEDGAIKAETLRRNLVTRGLKTQNNPLRMCFGVSEFPSLSGGADDLLNDAEKACQQVLVSGKNKVCLYSEAPDHQREFKTAPRATS